ncbi:MAG: glucarate dehydratase family protein [Bacteroidetes bacterium]|nr:glucarate dehydratase family protein [Bacteroidota bacterium]MDA1121621.1 glucarate dehydratase family protein [Bacteroidota bacterium]
MKGPKIRELRVTPIAVTDPPLLNCVGVHAPYALRTIIEIITDDGITGISEIPGNIEIDAYLEKSRELIVGEDPFQMNRVKQQLFDRFGQDESDQRGNNPWDSRSLVHVYSALEVACLDIQGKICGRPVVDLLGGRCRDSVPFDAYLFYKKRGAGGRLGFDIDPNATGWAAARQAAAETPEEIVVQARAMMKEFGFKSIKLKGGAFHPREEVEAMVQLRKEFGPDVPLRIDPNGVWSVETAIKYGRKMEGILEYLEDPTLTQQGMAEVRKALNMPLATNMCTTSFEEIPESVRLWSEDVILSDHHFWGGLRESINLGKVCQIFGKGLSMHSNSHLGISLIAMVHMAAAIPNLTYDLDSHYPWQSDEVIVGGRVKFDGGRVAVPLEPGLGIELDHSEVERLHKQYLDCGLTHRDDTAEMKKLDPSWEYKPVRW